MRKKLTSRKLWMSIASFVSMLAIYFGAAEGEIEQISALIMAGASVIGYVIGEGLSDAGNGCINLSEPLEVKSIEDETKVG